MYIYMNVYMRMYNIYIYIYIYIFIYIFIYTIDQSKQHVQSYESITVELALNGKILDT